MNTEYIIVDGAKGEGGGQVLRASLALSMALGRPFRMVNIRANRPKPGLMRQHLACLRAARDICGAQVTGDAINSVETTFIPGPVKPGEYRFDIGSGGSCTMVLQALTPPLLTASGASRITVTGGTHVPHAPPFEFMRDTLFPWLEKLGPRLAASMGRIGFMQVGGGSITVDIEPVSTLAPFDASKCGEFEGAHAHIRVYNLHDGIAQRESEAMRVRNFACLELGPGNIDIDTQTRSEVGPGNTVSVTVRRESGITICSAIGMRGVSAESVARQAASRALFFVKADVPVESHLADQLLVPLALAGGGSFVTEKPSSHTRTCIELIPLFTNIGVSALRQSAKAWRITLEERS